MPVKFALVRAGVIGSGEVRLPLSEMSKANTQLLVRTLAALGR